MKNVKTIPKKVLVLGAGPAGLSAAWKLAESGKEVTVLEKYDIPGGLCRTIKKDEFIFDLGGHRFLTQDKEVLDEIVNLMGDNLLQRPRTSVILLKKKYFKYPLDSKDLIFKMNPITSIICFFDYIFTRLKIKLFPKKDDSFEDWVINRFGKSLYNIYFGPYSKKLWGISPKKISADWSAQRISLLNLWDVFLRLFGKKKNTPKTYAKMFYYPQKGIGQIAEEMVKKIEGYGGKIYFNYCAKEFKQEGKNISEIIAQDKSGTLHSFSADQYVSTIPLDSLILGSTSNKNDTFNLAAKRMSFRGVLFLFMIVDLPKVTDNTWMYIPEEHYFFFRIQEPRNWSPTTVPPGKTSLILEISCSWGDSIWNMSDEEIYNKCVDSLKKLKLFDVSKITEYFTSRIGHAYPIYDLNYKEYLTVALNYANSIENLISIGREGLYRYNNMDHSIKMGLMAAKYLQGEIPFEEILKIAIDQGNFESNQAQI